jgi:phosphoglycerol transferase
LTKDKPILAMVGAATLVFVVLVDQTPPIITRRQTEQTARTVDSDSRFTREIESRLPPGAMLFQLPVVDFPEAFPGACYDHFRPYLFSRHLRFSFGAVKGRARDEWVHALNSVSAEEAIGILTRYGFAAIYVDRAQYQDRGQELFEGFTKMELNIVQSPRRDLFCVFLKPK